MKIKYVGAKPDGETAFSDKTGITWHPGDVHEVKEAVAAAMLKHPDVFAIDAVEVVPTKADAPISASITLADGSVVALDALDKEALHALAKEQGVAIHHAAGSAKVVEALVAAFAIKPTE